MKITRKQLKQLIKEATAETEKKVTLSDGNEYTVHCSDEFVTKCSTGSCEPPIRFTDFDGEDLKTITGACPIKMNENNNVKRTINEANITPEATQLINWLKSAGVSTNDAYSALSDWQAREGEASMKAIAFFIKRNTDMHKDWKGVLSALHDFRHDDYGNGTQAGLLKFLDDAWTGKQPSGYGKKLSGRTASLREGSLKITRKQLRQIINEEVARVDEGEVVDMFSGDQTKQNAVERIARALAARAEEMLDADGDGDDVAVHVDHKLFLSPYADIDGDGREVRPLAQSVYEDYVSGKAGDQAESLDSIVERISIDYFDEDIEYALEALGDDRWTMPHTWNDDEDDQMMKTKDLASQQDPGDIGQMDLDFERFLQGLGTGEIEEFPDPEDLA